MCRFRFIQLFRSLRNTIGIGILGAIMSSRMTIGMKELFANSGGSTQSQIPPDRAK